MAQVFTGIIKRTILTPLRPFLWLFLLSVLLTGIGCQSNTAVPPTPITISETALGDATPTLSSAVEPLVERPDLTAVPTDVLATVTPRPTITPTPFPEERVDIGQHETEYGNFSAAIDQFSTGLESGALDEGETVESRFGLGVAYYEEAQFSEAIAVFEALLDETAVPPQSHYYLAQSHANLSNWQSALDAYEQFLELTPALTAYIAPLMAEAYFALGDSEAAVAALETAVSAPSHYLTEYDNRQRLIAYHQSSGNTQALIDQYNATHDLAQTDFTKGQMTYLAGMAELQRGNTDTAYEQFGFGVVNYPRVYESYLGLVQLVEAGVPVNDYQRGLVNYYANSYEPCVDAFNRYIASAPEDFVATAFLFQAYCYEGLGDLTSASAAHDSYAISAPAEALAEAGWMWARAGLTDDAEATFLDYIDQYPDGEQVVDLLWQTAVYAANRDDVPLAVERFVRLADNYGWHEDAPEALFRAGNIAQQSGDVETAVQLWNRSATEYPAFDYGAASTVWLLKTLPTVTEPISGTTEADVLALIEPDTAVDFFHLRAEDIATGIKPFDTESPFAIPSPAQIEQAQKEAEAWLKTWLEIEGQTPISDLPTELANDPRLVRGEALWQIGLLEMAKRELEAVRVSYGNDPLASYQLALYFRNLGLYRSSIWAATAVLNHSGQNIREAPRFLGQLIYPVYYADLIMPLANDYGYDPRIQFALVRQESLFESFARSGAAAQGLSQVIPDTGAYIATQLNWPDFENEDLYKPYVGLNFGAFYLAQQLGFFDGTVHSALAAYNAGPGNAARWYEVAGDDIDLYYQTTNFAETREYIKRIYVGYEMYRLLYDVVDGE